METSGNEIYLFKQISVLADMTGHSQFAFPLLFIMLPFIEIFCLKHAYFIKIFLQNLLKNYHQSLFAEPRDASTAGQISHLHQ